MCEPLASVLFCLELSSLLGIVVADVVCTCSAGASLGCEVCM